MNGDEKMKEHKNDIFKLQPTVFTVSLIKY